jgi:prepilin-type N-terminal cleavage/methylation domain-containing protein
MTLRFIKTKGFSLMEVLMSLLLISLILLGLDAGQLYTMNEVKTIYFYNLAENQMSNAIERLSALKMYDGLNEELTRWNAENQIILPQGFGTITGSFPNYMITIYWGNISHSCKKEQIGLSGCLIKKIQLA